MLNTNSKLKRNVKTTIKFQSVPPIRAEAARHEPRGIYWPLLCICEKKAEEWRVFRGEDSRLSECRLRQNYSRSSVRAKCWKITKGTLQLSAAAVASVSCSGLPEAGSVALRAGLFCIAAGLTTWGCPELGAFSLAAWWFWFMS